MSSRLSRTDSGISVSFIASAVIHLAVFLLLAWWGQLSPSQAIVQETYYVDVVELPTANPSGTTQKTDQVAAAPPSPPSVPAMTAPQHSKALPKVIAKPARPKALQQDPVAPESAFAERMAALEKNIGAQREEAILEKLRKKMKTGVSSKAGAPGANGAAAGSRYADYLKSRLEDALKVTSSYTSKNPEVAVQLTISGEGKLVRVKIERSSGDAAFELAVRRAIDLASEKFTVPPNRSVFENGFIFKPKGISSGTSR